MGADYESENASLASNQENAEVSENGVPFFGGGGGALKGEIPMRIAQAGKSIRTQSCCF